MSFQISLEIISKLTSPANTKHTVHLFSFSFLKSHFIYSLKVSYINAMQFDPIYLPLSPCPSQFYVLLFCVINNPLSPARAAIVHGGGALHWCLDNLPVYVVSSCVCWGCRCMCPLPVSAELCISDKLVTDSFQWSVRTDLFVQK